MTIPRDEGHNCSASPAEWILFVGSLWTLWTSWWIPELVEVAAHRRGGMPLRRRLSVANVGVQWNCTRILAPGFTAIMSMSRARSPEQWAVLYYFGYEPEYGAGGVIPGLTAWQWAKLVLMDLPPLMLQIPLFVYSASLHRHDISVPLMPHRWVMSSVPAALTGLLLLAMSAFPALRPRRVCPAFWCIMTVLAAMCLTFLLTIYFFTDEGHVLRWATFTSGIFIWGLLMFPVQLGLCCGYLGPMLLYFISAVGRLIPMLMDMLTGGKRFPFCGANHVATAAVFVLFAGFYMWHGATTGGTGVEKYCRAEYGKMRQAEADRKRNASRGDEEAVSLQSRERLVQEDRGRVS